MHICHTVATESDSGDSDLLVYNKSETVILNTAEFGSKTKPTVIIADICF